MELYCHRGWMLTTRDGYSVSFDIDTLRNGDFDKSLFKRIEQCNDFILIVDKHAFDRSLDSSFDRKKDWLRCELAYALELKKNIIPILLAGVDGFPENLPSDIVAVSMKNGPRHDMYYFDSFYKKLCKDFLLSSNNGSKYDFRDLLQDNDVPIGLEDWNNTCRHSKFIDFLKKIFREK